MVDHANTVAATLTQLEAAQAASARRFAAAANFGPWDQPWHFMPRHLPLSKLAASSAAFSEQAQLIAGQFLGDKPGQMVAVQLDVDIWVDRYVAKLAPGAVLPMHSHDTAGVLYVVSGALRVNSAAAPGDSIGDSGMRLLATGGAAKFVAGGQHQVEILEPSVVIEAYSPQLKGNACHQHLARDSETPTPSTVNRPRSLAFAPHPAPPTLRSHGADGLGQDRTKTSGRSR